MSFDFVVLSSCVLQYYAWISGLRSVSNLLVISLHWSGGRCACVVTGHFRDPYCYYVPALRVVCGRYRYRPLRGRYHPSHLARPWGWPVGGRTRGWPVGGGLYCSGRPTISVTLRDFGYSERFGHVLIRHVNVHVSARKSMDQAQRVVGRLYQ